MDDYTKHYTYILTVYFKGMEEPCIFHVRKKASERFLNCLDSLYSKAFHSSFNCSTLGGRTVSINLEQVQASHIQWQPTKIPEEETRHDGPIKVFLSNRKAPVELEPMDSEGLYEFFFQLENYIEEDYPFKGFKDIDDELIMFRTKEILYAECSKHMFDEGWQTVNEQEESEEP